MDGSKPLTVAQRALMKQKYAGRRRGSNDSRQESDASDSEAEAPKMSYAARAVAARERRRNSLGIPAIAGVNPKLSDRRGSDPLGLKPSKWAKLKKRMERGDSQSTEPELVSARVMANPAAFDVPSKGTSLGKSSSFNLRLSMVEENQEHALNLDRMAGATVMLPEDESCAKKLETDLDNESRTHVSPAPSTPGMSEEEEVNEAEREPSRESSRHQSSTDNSLDVPMATYTHGSTEDLLGASQGYDIDRHFNPAPPATPDTEEDELGDFHGMKSTVL